MKTATRVVMCAVLTIAFAYPALAQDAKSAPLAQQLAAALEAAQMDAVAAKDPSKPDTFVSALYFKGLQLLVVSGKYSAPLILDEKIGKKEYRDVYMDLNGAAIADTKIFIEDLGADGLMPDHDNNTPFDACEVGGKRTAFDGDWRRQQLSEDDYKKAFSKADEEYGQMLTALLAQVKKPS
jgi:hypothetical protein